VAPGKLAQLKSGAAGAAGAPAIARLSPATFAHPALASAAADSASDAGRGVLTTWWRLDVDANDAAAGVSGRLDTGEPLMAERSLGRGRVILLAAPLDCRSGNLPTLNCFVPLMHETIAYLAEPATVEPNGRVGQDVIVPLRGAGGRVKRGQRLEVVAPDGSRRRAAVVSAGREPRVRFAGADEPGLYRLLLPATLAKSCAAMCPDGNGVPMVVADTLDESSPAALTDADLASARRLVRAGLDRTRIDARRLLLRADTTDELLAAVSGGIPGVELWQILAVVLLAAVVAESAVARWVAARRAVPPARGLRQENLTDASFAEFREAGRGRPRDARTARQAGQTVRT